MEVHFEALKAQVKQEFSGDNTGHDWYHIQRVLNLSQIIQREAGGDRTVIKYAALLHDISDHKFNGGDFEAGEKEALKRLDKQPIDARQKQQIGEIIRHISFKGAGEKNQIQSLEGKIVQDADRLDALGAIGIARTFAFGGHSGQPIYDPEVPPKINQTKAEYSKRRSHTINHFYEKLLLLEEQMHTDKGKSIARERSDFMRQFLEQFYDEWNL